ncbi:MAG: bacterio-opsin activator domain-containing protein, partial [Halalkalicoccus sp.]
APARLLADVVRSLDGSIALHQDRETLTVEAGRAHFQLRTHSPDDFPQVSGPVVPPVTLASKGLAEALLQVVRAAATEESRPVLQGVLVEATTREGIERAVCDRLTTEDAYEVAWVGERVPTRGVIAPTTVAGAIESDAVGPVTDSADPVAAALETGSARFVPEEVPAAGDERTTAAIPLVSGETSYGVLVVYGRGDAFDDHERVVLQSIGRAIANACNTLESRRILTADTSVELAFDLDGEDLFFVSLSARGDCRFEYEGSAHDGDSLLFFTVEGCESDRLVELADGCPDVSEATVLTAEGAVGLFEFRLSGASLATKLANRGVRISSMRAEGGEGRLTLLVPGGVSPRSVAELVTDACPGATLAASREHDRPPETDEEYRLSVQSALTDRQLLALRKAYASGYFDPTRRITGAGISRSTSHQHLRAAERKLLAEFFDRGIPD